jgi:hypothetical protein
MRIFMKVTLWGFLVLLVCAFGRVNGGLAFQGFQQIAGNAVPLCHVFYTDKAGSTKNCTHHPIYSKYLNYCCETPEKGHKLWVGQQGSKTNQGPEVQLTIMLHSLRKECSSLLCEAVKGEFQTQIHLKT